MYGCTSYRVSGDEGVLVREEQQGKEFKGDMVRRPRLQNRGPSKDVASEVSDKATQ